MRAVELFAGCGGMALGFERAGFRHELLVDNDKWAAASLRRNRPAWNVKRMDVRDLRRDEMENLDLISGGPPCQPFSNASVHRRGPGDRRDMMTETVELIREAQPKSFVLENVPALKHSHGRYYDILITLLSEAGYLVSSHEVNCADYGVAQTRMRLFMIGFRRDIGGCFNFPLPSRQPEEYRTVEQALEGLWPPDTGMPNHNTPSEGVIQRKNRYFPKIFRRMNTPDAPAKTIMGRRAQWNNYLKYGNDPKNSRYRYLTDRECMRLQGFPDDWVVEGGITACVRQVGNALPPPVAVVIGLGVIEHIKQYERNNHA